MLFATTVKSVDELDQILALQKQNLRQNIDETEMISQGFVTMQHTPRLLQQMHELAPAIIVKDEDKVVAYALAMARECRQLLPPLEPMFAILDQLQWRDKFLNEYRFYVMGQICVGKDYRGKGLVGMLYGKHKDIYQKDFDFIITEISTGNHRSLKAHERIGFKNIHTHRDELDEWAVVIWDWR